MGQKSSGLNCCQQEGYLASTSELSFDNRFLHEHCGDEDEDGANVGGHSHPSNCRLGMQPGSWGPLDDGTLWCVRDHTTCAVEDEPEGSESPGGRNMESLSYVPVRFDEGATIDAERSQARYSKIVVHSARARTQRRTRAWEDWLRGATAGRPVTLVGFGASKGGGCSEPGCNQVPALYHLDRQLAKLTIRAASGDAASTGSEAWQILVIIDNIQVICPATDFMFFFDQADAKLDDGEKARAVLLQYTTEDDEKKRVCFLEETELEKERFIQALTALWLEKRNDHSMWF